MVCDAVEIFPQASVAVHVLVTEYVPAQLPCTVTSSEVSVNADAQASVAVGVANTGTAGQSMVEGAGNSEITGAVMSCTFMVCEAVEVFPQASVAVQVLTIEYEPAQVPLIVASLKLKLTKPEQLSVAVATAKLGNAGQLIVEAVGNDEITGATVSLILIVCETEAAFPQASVNVQVRKIVNEFGHDPGVITSIPAEVILPEQRSVAVREIIAGTFSAQETVMLAGACGTTGAVVSTTVKVAVVVTQLPQTSVAVKITVTDVEQSADSVEKLLVHVTVEQLSEAIAPPLLASQALKESVFPCPLHSTVVLEAETVTTGAVTSCTFMVCVAVDILPQPSVAVHVLVTE